MNRDLLVCATFMQGAQYMRANWLSNRVLENYDPIIEAICEAWSNLIEIPETIKSIGMRE
jgi:hypothetical protein